jgi:hypothetical protein
VETFKEAIRLRVIGSGGLVMNVEEGTKGFPKGGRKLWAKVRGDDGWDTKARYSCGEEGLGTIGSSGRGKWDNFWPSGGADYNVEKGGGRGRKWAYKVNMDVGKFLWWDRDVLRNGVSVVVNFVELTGGTLAGPVGKLGGHTTPEEAGGNKPFGRTNSRVGQIVKMFENGALKVKWDKWVESGSRGIT